MMACSPRTDTYSMSTRPLTSQPFSAESNPTHAAGVAARWRPCVIHAEAAGQARRRWLPPLQSQKVIMTMRLRTSYGPYSRLPERNNRHISCGSEHTGHPRLMLLREGGERHGSTNRDY